MKQSTIIPQTTLDRVVEQLDTNIADPSVVTCLAEIFLEDPATKERSLLKRASINVNEVLAAAVTDGHLTGANVTGYKKCTKAICAAILNLAYTEVGDPIS